MSTGTGRGTQGPQRVFFFVMAIYNAMISLVGYLGSLAIITLDPPFDPDPDPRISVDNWIKGGLGPTISKTQFLQTITQSIQTKNTIHGDQSAIQTDPK